MPRSIRESLESQPLSGLVLNQSSQHLAAMGRVHHDPNRQRRCAMTACTRRDNPMKSIALALAVVSMFVMAPARAQETPLLLEKKISLGEVRGRIDHLAVDLKRNRLFVAELENDTVGVVDLDAGKVTQVIFGLKHPQGLGYHPWTDAL